MKLRLLQRRTARTSSRRGAVLVLALIAVVTVSAMAAGFLQLAAARSRSQAAAVSRKEAFYLAEAGLAESYVGLRAGRTGNVGTEATPAAFGNGLFWVEAEDLGNEQVALHSTGMSGRARVNLDIVVERGAGGSQPLGVYTSGSLSLPPGTRVDSYDSNEGPYADQVGRDAALEAVAAVGSGSDLALSGTALSPVVIRGDVSYGTGASYTKGEHVYVGGEEGTAAAAASLAPVELPNLTKSSSVSHSSAIPLVIAPGEHAFQNVTLGANAEAVLEGPMVLLAGDLTLERGARLVADTTAGSVEVYVEDNMSFARGTMIENLTSDPQLLTIQYAGSNPAQVAITDELHGTLYAPDAEIVLADSVEIFGSLSAAQLTAARPLTLHFDRALGGNTERAMWPELLTWRIIEMVENPRGQADPYDALGLVRGTLPAPAQAHEDQTLVLDYLDDLGNPQTYNGPESAFDWTDVSEIATKARNGQVVHGKAPAATPAVLASDQQALVDNLLSISSALAKTLLIATGPAADEVLVQVLPIGVMTSADATAVLLDASPLGDRVLGLVFDGSAGLDPLDRALVRAAQ